jgi:ABC-type multidrug transport system fused ATPase/permease subunit
MKTLFRALSFFKDNATHVYLLFVLMSITILTQLILPWPIALAIDCSIGKKPFPYVLSMAFGNISKVEGLIILGSLVLLTYLLHIFVSTTYNNLLIRTGLAGLMRVRLALFNKLLQLSPRFFSKMQHGDVVYRASWDTFSIQTLFQQGLFTVSSAVLTIGLMLIIMFQINLTLALIALGTVPLLVAVIRGFVKPMEKAGLSARDADSSVSVSVEQSIVALPLIQASVTESREYSRFQEKAFTAFSKRYKQHRIELIYQGLIMSIFALGTAFIVVSGGLQAMEKTITIGELWVFLSYLSQFYGPLTQISYAGSTISTAFAGVNRVLEILDAESIHDSLIAHQNNPVPPAAPVKKKINGQIRFSEVHFSYENNKTILNNLNFTIQQGESVLLIGPSGSGKTTLLMLILRFYEPDHGIITIDDIDIRQMDPKDLRNSIAISFQEAFLLPGTILENIAYSVPNADMKDVYSAAELACADDFIKKLSKGYHTSVGEGFSQLSTGEKQRINIARALLKKSPILILDEPLTGLDEENQKKLANNLKLAVEGRTTLIVTHNPDMFKWANKILKFENGCIKELYTPNL